MARHPRMDCSLHGTMSMPRQKKAATMREFLSSLELVNEGHPDKICVQVSGTVMHTRVMADPMSTVIYEIVKMGKMATVASEVSTQANVVLGKFVRDVGERIGCDPLVDDLSSVDSRGLLLHGLRSVARGMRGREDGIDVGAGEEGIMFGYPGDVSDDCTPSTHAIATPPGTTSMVVRKGCLLRWPRPGDKSQVTIEYLQRADASVEPQKIHIIAISTRHAKPLKAIGCKACDGFGYTGPGTTAPLVEDTNKLIEKEEVQKTMADITRKNGASARTLLGDGMLRNANSPGMFIDGGSQGDAGLTGRKVTIGTCGAGGACDSDIFSGKDPAKVECCAPVHLQVDGYVGRRERLSRRALAQLSYAIGVAMPLLLVVVNRDIGQGNFRQLGVTASALMRGACHCGDSAAVSESCADHRLLSLRHCDALHASHGLVLPVFALRYQGRSAGVLLQCSHPTTAPL
mmetsp:Transcript_64983/g.211788  ORF Transcript_64983/g.211788 Transcript_64983/m.211788 type:complete len:459 (-) Transcript_64983:296-1672(-)